jgi:apolipoprotein N-acyltransferase
MPSYFTKQLSEFLHGWRGVGIALGSGWLMGLSVSPTDAWYLGWIALAPLWAIVACNSPRGVARYGLCWGIGYHGIVLSWILGVHPMTWMGVPWGTSLVIAISCLVFLTLWGAALVTIWASLLGLLQRYLQPAPWLRILWGTALWCGLEYLWSQGDLWWSTLALGQSPNNLPILHLGQLSGGMAVTALLVAVNGAIGETWLAYSQQKSWKAPALSALGLLLTGHLVGYALYQTTPIPNPSAALQVGIIQGNIPNEIKLYPTGRQKAIEGYTTGYLELATQGVSAILTPEGALPYYPDEIRSSSLYAAVQAQGVPIWLGAFGRAGDNYTNSLHAIDGNGNFLAQYNKYKLVPLGEYVPFKEILGQWVQRLSPLKAQLQPGQDYQEFDALPGLRAIVGICYESAFGEHFRQQAHQGEFILTASNNAHYAANMPAQHHAQDVMRAIETSRWAVRATNTGYSAIVDPHGHTLWRSNLNQFAIHRHQIYRQRQQTLYVRWGDWLTPTLLGTSLGLGLAVARRRIHRTIR